MELTLAPAVIGFVSAIVTEAFKFIPWLRFNELTKAATAIVVILAAIFITYGTSITSWADFAGIFSQALVYALTSYKAIIQPIAVTSGSKTQ